MDFSSWANRIFLWDLIAGFAIDLFGLGTWYDYNETGKWWIKTDKGINYVWGE